MIYMHRARVRSVLRQSSVHTSTSTLIYYICLVHSTFIHIYLVILYPIIYIFLYIYIVPDSVNSTCYLEILHATTSANNHVMPHVEWHLMLDGGFCTMQPQVMKMPHSPAIQQTLGRYANIPRASLDMANNLAAIFKTNPPTKSADETQKVLNCLALQPGYQNQLDTNVTKAKNKCSNSCVVTG